MREAATICPAPCKLTFDLESGVRVTCDVAYLCANFSLPRPLCSRLRPDVLYATDVRRALLLNSTTLEDIMIGSVCKNIRQSLVYAFNMPICPVYINLNNMKYYIKALQSAQLSGSTLI